MLQEPKVGGSVYDVPGTIERVITTFCGMDAPGSFTCDTLCRIDGKWYAHTQSKWQYMGGYNGGALSRRLPDITDDNVEAYAAERRAKWLAGEPQIG